LLLIARADYEALTLQVPIMDRYFRLLYQNSLATKDRRLISSHTHSAEEKYRQLAQSHPQMLQRVPQHLIASYLGLAPETISRIRKNLTLRQTD
jgi:CRP-like cAMP-binding protein